MRSAVRPLIVAAAALGIAAGGATSAQAWGHPSVHVTHTNTSTKTDIDYSWRQYIHKSWRQDHNITGSIVFGPMIFGNVR